MGIIKAKDLVHEYIRRDEEGNVESIQTALDKVSLDVKKVTYRSIRTQRFRKIYPCQAYQCNFRAHRGKSLGRWL